MTYVEASVGWLFGGVAMCTILGNQIISASEPWFLRSWASRYTSVASKERINNSSSVTSYVAAYAAISIAACITLATQALVLYSGSIKASRILYKKLTSAVLQAPLRWMDTIRTGQILEAFINDFKVIDQRLMLVFDCLSEFCFRLVIIILAR